ncbi:hypothetical protein NDI37_10130 [Funiculus sociatus GB2-A5]|uniref:Uncharacterized protein n=1 Tax=Funiculus sociatus GB2-A5 TaxID=2933946 RepID=A0ABV0JN13_9CYAN|nr:hypothetical protein [Trichocoleus sp. FACHB-69]
MGRETAPQFARRGAELVCLGS